ncbi:MAG TPA: hypothetical protein CFH84_11605 [Sulfurimonas sp. UBA12504]|nr:MAG TPA: hypothetical protein CFH84_11605 [Sulfurimonas sp. UBA12504]
MIDVKNLIDSCSVEEHLVKADNYFNNREEHLYLYQKPFHSAKESASSVHNLGQLLELASLKEGNKVLDFAAGSCWLSKILIELGCEVVSTDASLKALEIGKQLFKRHPPIRHKYKEPIFDLFNGKSFNYLDETFDRIIVNDAFHHIPNTKVILKEFYRILKNDGYVVMSEPGRYHSASHASQYEMKNFGVIENDFILEDIWSEASSVGFKNIEILPILKSAKIGIEEYQACIDGEIPKRIKKYITQDTINRSIFRLSKKEVVFNKINEKAFEFNKYLSQMHFLLNTKINRNEQYILYGAGTGAELILSMFHENILYIVDQNVFKHGTYLQGKMIYDLQKIKDFQGKLIISVFGRAEQIVEQLSNDLNFKKEKIISLDF